ncbi:MAG: DUF2293 domain-containing protein [Actinomycetota bacterium]
MAEPDLTALQLDVYMTRNGPWNPDHGDIEIPEDWEFLPSGDAFVTRRVKAAGAFWVAWRPRGRNRPHRRKLGLWAPKDAIDSVEAEAEATEDERSKRREQSAKGREKQEDAYRVDFADAIRRFLAFAPEHAGLADEIARDAAARAAVVGSGRVGRTKTLTLDKRAALAARALIRHRNTSYDDDLFDAEAEDPWGEESWYREVKAEAQWAVDEFLERHRETPSGGSSDGG